MAIEPESIVALVEGFVSDEYRADVAHGNRTPLDESGVWTLHRLAADIYAAGFDAGERAEEARSRGARQRKVEVA